MNTLTASEERAMLSAVKQAASLVSTGLTPDEAVEKVARDLNLSPAYVPFICHAYNTGQQLDQLRHTTGILDKLASFPLADPAEVSRRLGEKAAPAEKAASIDPDYRRAPDWADLPERTKLAHTPLPKLANAPATVPVGERVDALRQAWGNIERLQKKAQECQRQSSEAQDQTYRAIRNLVGYFKQASYDRRSFAEFEQAAEAYGGEDAKKLAELVYVSAGLREKRASGLSVLTEGFDPNEPPLTLMKQALDAAHKLVGLRRLAADAKKEAQTAEVEEIRPFIQPEKSVTPSIWNPKVAGILGTPAVGAFAGSVLSRGIGPVNKTKDELVGDTLSELEDPEHANELRKIQAHTLLTSMMTDPDDPISGHDPDAVLSAFNDIAQIAPATAQNRATLGPELRRRLEGHQEPFEIKNLLDTEKSIAKPSPSLIRQSQGVLA